MTLGDNIPSGKDYLGLIPKVAKFNMSRRLNTNPPLPISLTVSITNVCNSKCKTCNIWKMYPDHLDRNKELKLEEYEKIFSSLGKGIFWYTISGGEPLIRPDVVDIFRLMKKYNDPRILIIPTNGLLPDKIYEKVSEILAISGDTSVIINISIDGIGEDHDVIRGVEGNFEKVKITYEKLHTLKEQYPNLDIGMHSVVSRFSVDKIMDVYAWVKENIAPDSYICEIAENREEFFNMDDEIAPDKDKYSAVIKQLREALRTDYLTKDDRMVKMLQQFRIEYYSRVVQQLQEQKENLPCYAGWTSGHISPYGDVWPCCIKAYGASFGNLRDYDYDFSKVWRSEKAKAIRPTIKKEHCFCPMANVHYTNMVSSPSLLARIVLRGVF